MPQGATAGPGFTAGQDTRLDRFLGQRADTAKCGDYTVLISRRRMPQVYGGGLFKSARQGGQIRVAFGSTRLFRWVRQGFILARVTASMMEAGFGQSAVGVVPCRHHKI